MIFCYPLFLRRVCQLKPPWDTGIRRTVALELALRASRKRQMNVHLVAASTHDMLLEFTELKLPQETLPTDILQLSQEKDHSTGMLVGPCIRGFQSVSHATKNSAYTGKWSETCPTVSPDPAKSPASSYR